MNNADMPANPINADYRVKVNGVCLSGLTKREYFAGLVMQGLVADGTFKEGFVTTALIAIQQADELLRALEK